MKYDEKSFFSAVGDYKKRIKEANANKKEYGLLKSSKSHTRIRKQITQCKNFLIDSLSKI